jgi:hypothetical protein
LVFHILDTHSGSLFISQDGELVGPRNRRGTVRTNAIGLGLVTGLSADGAFSASPLYLSDVRRLDEGGGAGSVFLSIDAASLDGGSTRASINMDGSRIALMRRDGSSAFAPNISIYGNHYVMSIVAFDGGGVGRGRMRPITVRQLLEDDETRASAMRLFIAVWRMSTADALVVVPV